MQKNFTRKQWQEANKYKTNHPGNIPCGVTRRMLLGREKTINLGIGGKKKLPPSKRKKWWKGGVALLPLVAAFVTAGWL